MTDLEFWNSLSPDQLAFLKKKAIEKRNSSIGSKLLGTLYDEASMQSLKQKISSKLGLNKS